MGEREGAECHQVAVQSGQQESDDRDARQLLNGKTRGVDQWAVKCEQSLQAVKQGAQDSAQQHGSAGAAA